jgi:D-arginine dehydrogenase
MVVRRAVVVGGGIAGLSVLYQLTRRGIDALLLEREPVLAAHASGKNAAIYRPLEDDRTTAGLSRRTLELLAELDAGLLPRRSGLLLIGGAAERARALHAHGVEQGVRCELLDRAGLLPHAPELAGGTATAGVWVPDGGVFDPHAITSALASHGRGAGGRIRVACGAAGVRVADGRCTGVELEDGEVLEADCVVLCGGAWGRSLGDSADAPLPLTPLRRHLVQLQPRETPRADAPTVWRLDDDVYYRPETGGVLASPCDETRWEPCDPPVDPASLELLAGKLERTAPVLASANVLRPWACLRTFAPDRELVAGADPRVVGLGWLGGLGGRGMSVGLAAAEVVVAELLGDGHPLAEALSPARLLRARG